MKRRDFFKLGSALAAVSALNATPLKNIKTFQTSGHKVNFLGEGLALSPNEYSEILLKMTDEGKIKPDYYSNGGIVEELEDKFAKIFNKERAVFFPTGTMANHVAIRNLANGKKRAVVQEESHIYNDCGDCVQNLSNINLIPLGKDSATFSLEDLEKTLSKTRSGRVKSEIGVISIESPVRRKYGQVFGFEEIKKISSFAKNNDIKMHMDGARLFAECAFYDSTPSDYSPYFDTVYTSLYKCFNAASGAVLVGTNEFCNDLYHTRRMMGGGLPNVWAFAAVALNYVDNYLSELTMAKETANKLFDHLNTSTSLKIQQVENGTNLFWLEETNNNLSSVVNKLIESGLIFRSVRDGQKRTLFALNPSFNRKSITKYKQIFDSALRQ